MKIKGLLIIVIKKEVKKQEESACFLLGYQPKFPQKDLSKHSEQE